MKKKQEELAIFNDANRNLVSNVAKTTQERLNNEYTLLFGVYSELAKQREQANIQVKRNDSGIYCCRTGNYTDRTFKTQKRTDLYRLYFFRWFYRYRFGIDFTFPGSGFRL